MVGCTAKAWIGYMQPTKHPLREKVLLVTGIARYRSSVTNSPSLGTGILPVTNNYHL
jgi:hypothetical protein